MRSSLVPLTTLAAVAALAACGGRIADDPYASADPGRLADPAPASSPSAPSVAQPPSRPPAGDLCEALCERTARCGASRAYCLEDCASEKASVCSEYATPFMQCYADNVPLDACTVIPPVCEDAYCVYARCAGKVVPSYCH